MSSEPAGLYDAFDRSNGNGSSDAEDDWLDNRSIFGNEWGSTAATTFNPSDTDGRGNPLPPDKQSKFEDLYKLHNGRGESSRKQTIRQSHIENDARTFLSVLEMPECERERVLLILDNLNISSKNFGGTRRYEKIILSLCSLVSDEELSKRLEREEDPSIDNRLHLTDSYRDLMDAVEMSNRERRKIRQQIREKSDYFE